MLNKWSLKLSFYLLSLILLGFGNTIQAKFSNSLPEIKGSLNNIVTKTFPTLEKGHSFSKLTSANSNLLPPPIYSKHYIAPAPWQYWSKANQIVITTESTASVSGTIRKSDGALIADFNCKANVPFVMSFSGFPDALSTHPLNQIVSAAGLIVEATASISVNLRNIASDYNNSYDPFIKGNASLFSFGDAGIGTAFRVGYYRDGNLAGKDDQPIYSIMALDDNTEIKIAGVVKATLNKGQSYLFKCPIGTLVESTRSAVMNTSARLDAPEGCGDGAYNPIPPIISLGAEYVIVRGEGNPTAEQTTVVATEANTNVTVQFFDENGVQRDLRNFVIPLAGGFITFAHGYYNGTYNSVSNTGKYSSSRIVTTKNVVVFSGTAGASGGAGCEVDVATLVPIADCAGSRTVETAEFIDYSNGKLPYFGYILTKSPNKVFLTTQGGSTFHASTDIETISGIDDRKQLGSSGLFLIKFTDANIGSPKVITINSLSRLTVSMVQQSNKFSMSNFISRFAEKAAQPAVDLTDCTAAKLTADPLSDAPYQWYYNGVKIEGAVDNFYIATASGNYTVSSKLECGMSAQSMPLIVSVCSIDRAIEKSVDIPLPELNQVVNFTLKASNKSASIATGVLVRDLLPAGYAYVFSTASTGNYDAVTGEWLIGSMNPNSIETLTIKAKVIAVGAHTNTATITGTQRDNNVTNDESSARTTTVEGDVTLFSIGSENRTVCVNKPIDDIIFKIEGGASGATISGLPAGLAVIPYDSGTKLIKITGTPSAATSPAGITYTIETIGGIRVTKTGVIIVKENVTEPVFSSSLVLKRCLGAGSDSYTATSSNSDGIVYSIFPESAGTIDSATGLVMWAADFTGVADITAIALGCDEKKKKIFVNIYSRPAAPGTTHLKYCHNQIGVPVLTATGETNAIFTWYDASGAVIDGSIAPSTSAVGSITYYVTQKIGVDGCESEKSPLEVIIKSVPASPGTTHLKYCHNQTGVPALTATGEANAIFTWYDASGNVIDGSIPPSTSAVGSITYYVTQKIGVDGCESEKSPLEVIIKSVPAAPGTTHLKYCHNQIGVPVLTATGETNAIFTWYDASGNVIDGSIPPSTSGVGSTTYYVTQKIGADGCESEKSPLEVTIKPVPAAPGTTHLKYCHNQIGVPVLTATGETNAIFTWYDASGNVIDGSIPPSTSAVGTITYYVTQKIGVDGCESEKSPLEVIIKSVPAAPGTTHLKYCHNQTGVPALTATGEANAIFTWYDASGAVIDGSIPPSTSAVGTITYYVTQKIGVDGCESEKSPLEVIIKSVPAAPTATSATYCQNEVASVLTANGSNLIWYDLNGLLPQAPTPSTANAGVTEYYVTQVNTEGCEGPRTTITVTVKPTPPAPKASSVVYCQNEVASVLTANGSNLIWYDSNGLLPQAPTPSTANAGVTEYYVSQVNTEGCEGPRTTIKVSVKPIQEKLVITTSGPISFCVGGSVVLKSSNSSNYQWFKDNSIMIGEIEQTLIVAASGKYTVVSLNENGCKSVSSESTNVIVERIPARPTITAETPLEVCEGNTVQLSSSAPSGNIWYRNGVIIPGATNTTFNASLAGRYTLGVISAGGCVSQISDPIDVIINAPPKVPTISTQSSLVICKGSAALLVSSASSGNQWFKNGVVINGATSQNYLANAAGNYSVKTKNNSGCESLISNSISISVEAFELSLTASKTIAEFGSKVELKTSSNLKYKVLNWSPANLFNDAGAINQIFEFKNEIIVKVNAVSENGCPASATIKITLDKKRDLFIPNTFTPNGDGKNDVVKVLGTGIETIDWSIFSQWGELVYKSKERDAAWDGSFRGVMQPVGVYVYKCVVRFTDGEEMVKHGSINLLR